MKHPILGDIAREETEGSGVASLHYGKRHINVRIIADEIPYESTVEIAAQVVLGITDLDAKAKQVAASELTSTYNNGWNEYDEVQNDGTTKYVSKPKLSPDQFGQKLSLNGINVTGNMLELFYDDDGMFWGHSVVITSFDGIGFTETHAEIFG